MMAPTRYLVTSQQRGFDNGIAFNDKDLIENLDEAVIHRIVVRHDTYIRSLAVWYVLGVRAAVTRGALEGTITEICMEPDEYITKIEGSVRDQVMGHLAFTTNKRYYGPFGAKTTSSSFTLDAADLVSSDLAPRMGLLYLSGKHSASYLKCIQATFAEHGAHRTLKKLVAYEQQTNGEPAQALPARLSKFARNLMSPIVTLRVGPEGTEFRTYEDTLCQLPFFRAALQGQFREASEKTISMPEDEPEVISALVEFMYVGRYTYTYHHSATGEANSTDRADSPTSDATEGSFHASVHALASKYDCQELADTALGNFKCVLNELKGFEVIRLLKAAYAKELLLSSFDSDQDLADFKKRLPELVNGLYDTHRGEMERTIAEYPTLGSDLLCLVARGRLG